MSDLNWYVMPKDQGQIIEVAYACNWESMTLLRRSKDRSDGCVTVESARIEEDEDCFEPWNGRLPAVSEWKEVSDGGQKPN